MRQKPATSCGRWRQIRETRWRDAATIACNAPTLLDRFLRSKKLLKLKKLQILGFKSFCDRTELKFHGDGIAAIVGPNGCGKSNISDAISWVLGEQRAKSLRGAHMTDLIFAGTRERKPTGMAEVTLHLVDPQIYEGRVDTPVIEIQNDM